MKTAKLKKVDSLIAKGSYREAIEFLDAELGKAKDYDEICEISRKLAHLYRFGLKEKGSAKATFYGLLAGETYVHMGRVAPAVAMLHWLREIPEANEQAARLQRAISQQFSSHPSAIALSSDDALPPPTPYQELRAIVTFDQADVELSREQWKELRPKKSRLFSTLRADEVSRLVELGESRDLPPQTLLFREGEKAQAFYIVASGEMELTSSTGHRKIFREGDFFGEVALIGRMRRTATLRSIVETRLLEFSESAFRKMFEEFPTFSERVLNFYELRLFLNVASRSTLFRNFSETDLEEAWEFFTPVHVPSERTLIEIGQPSDRFFFIVQGYCNVYRDGEEVARLGPGQFVGEKGLIKKIPRSATVKAATECHLLECHELTFQELIKRFPKIQRVFAEIISLRSQEFEITDKVVID